MSLTDKHIQTLESVDGSEDIVAAREQACDALAFSQTLWDMYAQHGMVAPGSNVDFAILENLIDALHGELAAMCVFLAENSFEQVPKMLRLIADALDKDPAKSVPTVIIEGYRRAATRIEATRESIKKTKEALAVARAQENDRESEVTS